MEVVHIGGDHAGYKLKGDIIKFLEGKKMKVVDHGTYSADSTDYPDYAHRVARAVLEDGGMGILICGSANGVCMSANKHKGIRAALSWNTEVAILSRQHNDANIICLPARFVTAELAQEMTEKFLSTEFEGGRHQRRVEKINE